MDAGLIMIIISLILLGIIIGYIFHHYSDSNKYKHQYRKLKKGDPDENWLSTRIAKEMHKITKN